MNFELAIVQLGLLALGVSALIYWVKERKAYYARMEDRANKYKSESQADVPIE